jgi:tetratricopeptide (TPR) repeat protein
VSEIDAGSAVDPSSALLWAESLAGDGRISDADAVYRAAIDAGEGPEARLQFGGHLFRTDRLAEAEVEFRAALDAALRSGDGQLKSVATHHLAAICREVGDRVSAAAYQQQSISAGIESGDVEADDEWRGSTLSGFANDAILAGRYELAATLLCRSLALETAAASVAGQAADWGSLGLVATFQADYPRAVACLRRASALHRQLGDALGLGCDLLNLAEVARRLGRWHTAVRFLRRAVARLDSAHAPRHAQQARLLLEQANRVAQVPRRDQSRN